LFVWVTDYLSNPALKLAFVRLIYKIVQLLFSVFFCFSFFVLVTEKDLKQTLQTSIK